jgi:hypothetical protein
MFGEEEADPVFHVILATTAKVNHNLVALMFVTFSPSATLQNRSGDSRSRDPPHPCVTSLPH